MNHLADSGTRRQKIRSRDKKIAELEREYRDLMAARPPNMARLAEIISELGRLWNAKVRGEQNEELAGIDRAKDMGQLQKAVSKILREATKKMAEAQSKQEIHTALIEGMYEARRLMDE